MAVGILTYRPCTPQAAALRRGSAGSIGGAAVIQADSDQHSTPQSSLSSNSQRQFLWKKLISKFKPDRDQQQAGTAKEPENDEPVLEDHLQIPPPGSAAGAVADRAAWVSAIQLVAAVHVMSIAVGCLLRYAPDVVQSLQPRVLTNWLTTAAAAPSEHVTEVSLGLGILCVLLFAFEGVKSGAAASHTAYESRQEQPTGNASNSAGLLQTSFPEQVLVVELSVVAAALAAVACLNWALGYVACLALVPLALSCGTRAPVARTETGSSNRGGSKWKGPSVQSGFVLLLCFPVGVLSMLMLMSGVNLTAVHEVLGSLQWMVLQSSMGAYMLFWAVYAPFWCLSAWSADAQRQQ